MKISSAPRFIALSLALTTPFLTSCTSRPAQKYAYPTTHSLSKTSPAQNSPYTSSQTPSSEPISFAQKPLKQALYDSSPSSPSSPSSASAATSAYPTFVQVPEHIYLVPGNANLLQSQSATQHIRYQLVPSGRFVEAQNNPTPAYESKPSPNAKETRPASFTTSFRSANRAILTGTARTLGIAFDIPEEESRARALLRQGEELRYHSKWGWVGFTPNESIQPQPAPTLDTSTTASETTQPASTPAAAPAPLKPLFGTSKEPSSPPADITPSSNPTTPSAQPTPIPVKKGLPNNE